MSSPLTTTGSRTTEPPRPGGTSSVEDTLNALLDAEADRLCNAQRYERTEARRDTRAGHYERKLHIKAGEVRLKIPRLRRQDLRDGDHRALSAARVFGRGGADRDVPCRGLGSPKTSQKPCGTRVSPATVSDLNKKI
jgi:putative transposase